MTDHLKLYSIRNTLLRIKGDSQMLLNTMDDDPVNWERLAREKARIELSHYILERFYDRTET